MLVRAGDFWEADGRIIPINHGKSSAVRMLLKADGGGFSLSEARGAPGGSANLWYKHHWEANYVRQGHGTLEDLTDGRKWDLEPGMLYCVGPMSRHRLENTGNDGFRIVSIFNPPLEGPETHDEDGSYPPTGDIPEGQDKLFVKTQADVEAAGLFVSKSGGESTIARMLTARDNLGVALSDVRFKAGRAADLWYKNHFEANLVLEGTIEVHDKTTGETRELGPDSLYCVGPRDPHRITARTDVHLLSVFNPPVKGDETHDADGAYPPTGAIPEAWR